MPKVTHFEIPAQNPKKTMEFYKEVFEWNFQKWDGPIDYWFIEDDNTKEPGIVGAIAPKSQPDEIITNTISVKNIDNYIDRIQEYGGKITSPKHSIPGVGYLAYFSDLDGNLFGIMEDDETAV